MTFEHGLICGNIEAATEYEGETYIMVQNIANNTIQLE